MPKTITIGPGWEEPYSTGELCCTCCNKCTETSPVGLNSCPSHCCPCPPTGDICLTFYDLGSNCAGLDGAQFQLTRESGIPFCSGNPNGVIGGMQCYYPSVYTGCNNCPDDDWRNYEKTLLDYPHEKWAGTQTICDGDSGGCGSGERITISLCCCDTPSSAAQGPNFEDDCHGCRYQLRFEWHTWYNPPPGAYWGAGNFCTCPSGYYTSMDALIPPEYCSPDSANVFTWPMHKTECGSGNPDNWKTVFEITSGVWNCSCCTGDGVDTPNCLGMTNVRVIATPGTC